MRKWGFGCCGAKALINVSLMSSQYRSRGSPSGSVTWKSFSSYQADVKPSRGCSIWTSPAGWCYWTLARCMDSQTKLPAAGSCRNMNSTKSRKGPPAVNPPASVVMKINTLISPRHSIQLYLYGICHSQDGRRYVTQTRSLAHRLCGFKKWNQVTKIL